MLRIWLSIVVVSLLAACSTAPQQQSARSSGSPRITTPRAFAPPPGFPNFVDHSIGREEIPIQAMSLVGIPYRWGGNTPDAGFDCSGLVRYIVSRAANVSLPRTTAEMSTRGVSVEPDEIAPGDLVFFNTTGRPHSHVGIYVGKLRFVNAPSTGGTVRLDYLTNPYWAKHFDGIRRVAPPRHTPTPFDTPTYEADNRAPEPVPASPPPALSSTPRAAPAAVPAYAAARLETTPAAVPAPAAIVAAPATEPGTAVATNGMSPPVPNGAADGDAFEPPPAALSAAQRQARAAGATTAVATNPAAPVMPSASASANAGTAAAPRGSAYAAAPDTTPVANATAEPDAIDAAADAFEPPPPTARAAARQAQMASPDGVRIIRASTAPPPASGNGDDPIARFANGSY
ncbi:C40 family peptidase [Burkholderia plantarii]|uniref:C40 family peptidase n=1 Tax=Burkholderia plantarii TaxID=41899 RepID=UPI0006D8BC7D|nr:C40 family peptidase [Burkholderia plantarii]ALK30976.1 Lipoprotein, NLP/P60 family [Burkholderia plantarii]GLZ17401.1 peptidase [Burkholderia plantarii]